MTLIIVYEKNNHTIYKSKLYKIINMKKGKYN